MRYVIKIRRRKEYFHKKTLALSTHYRPTSDGFQQEALFESARYISEGEK